MATQHIEITGSASRTSSQLRSMIDQLQTARDNVVRLKAVFDQIAFDGDFLALGDALGLKPEEAQQVYNLLGDVQGELIKSSIAILLARLG